MSRFKLGVVGVLAAFVLLVAGGVGAATASAAFTLTVENCEGGTTINFCYETTGKTGLFELQGTEEFELLTAESRFNSNIGAEEFEILCKAVEAEHLVFNVKTKKFERTPDGVVTQPNPLKENYSVLGLFLTFLKCTLTAGPTKKCLVAETLESEEITGTPLTEEVIDFTPTAGPTPFILIDFINNGTEVCPVTIKGTQQVTGEQEAKWLTILVDEVEHTLDTVVHSGLRFGFTETAAELELEVSVFPLWLGGPWAIEETA